MADINIDFKKDTDIKASLVKEQDVNVTIIGGAIGSVGTSGTSGTSGQDGTNFGTSGTSGSSGTSNNGTSGSSATSGTGVSGTSGTSGTSSTSGSSGTSGIGTSGMSWSVVSGATNAAANKGYLIDTSAAPVTLTLPSTPSAGDQIGFKDAEGTFHSNVLTIGRNGKKIMGLSEDMTVSTQYASEILIYNDTDNGWRI
jgi:hypothetical protein